MGRLGQKEQRCESWSEETRTAPPGSGDHQSCTSQVETKCVFRKEAAVERGLQREDSQVENVEDGNSPGEGRLGSGRGLRK